MECSIERSINRYYDPATGQFVSVDPYVTQTLQTYVYTDDDPLNSADPSGLDAQSNLETAVTELGIRELN